MIDLHTHILPGFDDGAKDLAEALAMARLAAEDGITLLAATPHVVRGQFFPTRAEILAAVAELNRQLIKEGLPLRVLAGAEYRLEADLPRRLAAGELLTLNDGGRYLLVELPAEVLPLYAERVLYELQLRGVTPVLAHPERNAVLGRNPSFFRGLVSRGVLSQVTAASLTGFHGKEARRTAFSFLERSLAHLIASDAHSAKDRPPALAAALRQVESRLGREAARRLVENAQKVLAGRAVPADAAFEFRAGRRGFLGSFWGKFRR